MWSFQFITDHNKIMNTNNLPIFNLKMEKNWNETEYTVLYREIKIMNFIPHRKKEEIWIHIMPRKAIYFSHDTILLKQLFFLLPKSPFTWISHVLIWGCGRINQHFSECRFNFCSSILSSAFCLKSHFFSHTHRGTTCRKQFCTLPKTLSHSWIWIIWLYLSNRY